MKTQMGTIAGKENKMHRNQLASWLREWQIDCLLRPDSPPDKECSAAPETYTFHNFSPTAGQIVLLPPVSAPLVAERPIFILILEKTPTTLRVAPFSRFATPAVQAEWKTGLRAKPLRVLCLWNTHRVSARALTTGWLASAVKTQTLEQALDVYRHLHSDIPLKLVPRQKLGPPLRHPLDPRHVYLEDESSLMTGHLAFLEESVITTPTGYLYDQQTQPHLMAAEGHTRYTTRKRDRNLGK